MASQDSICDVPTEQVKPVTPSSDHASDNDAPPRKRAPRFGPARYGITKSPSSSPFIRERRLSAEKPAHTSRAYALGAVRRNASKVPGHASPDRNSPQHEDSPVAARRGRSPPRYWTPPRPHTATSGALSQSSPSTGSTDPMLHEIVRKVSSRSPLDGGAPADDLFMDAFIQCLQLVCDENEPRSDAAYPHDPAAVEAGEEEEGKEEDDGNTPDAASTASSSAADSDRNRLLSAVFPVSIARRYSPDFLRHMQRHMRLSRGSLAAALVYLDRAHKLAGASLTVCNKNVNTLVLAALIIASRVLEQRGYSDEIVAMAAGLGGAADVRRGVSFLLDALAWDAALADGATRPYERLLARLGEGELPEENVELPGPEAIRARCRTLRMYYPPSALRA